MAPPSGTEARQRCSCFRISNRYTLYGALLLLVFLWEESLAAFFRNGQFGVGVGTVVMLINAALLTS